MDLEVVFARAVFECLTFRQISHCIFSFESHRHQFLLPCIASQHVAKKYYLLRLRERGRGEKHRCQDLVSKSSSHGGPDGGVLLIFAIGCLPMGASNKTVTRRSKYECGSWTVRNWLIEVYQSEPLVMLHLRTDSLHMIVLYPNSCSAPLLEV